SSRAGDGDAQKPVVMVVLLPGYPQLEEIEQYYRLAGEGIGFIAEIVDPGITETITKKIDKKHSPFYTINTESNKLRLEQFKAGDDRLLARWLQNDLGNCPSLESDAIWADLGRIVNEDREVGVSQFMKTLTGVLERAIREGSNEVTRDHIMGYFLDDKFGH